MYSIRTAISLVSLVVVFTLVSLPAHAQGPATNLNSRVAALEAAVAALGGRVGKLESGQVDPADLVGTYAVQALQFETGTGTAPATRLTTEVGRMTFTLNLDFTATINSASGVLCSLSQETATTWSRACSPVGGQNVAATWFIDTDGSLVLQVGGQDAFNDPNFIGAGGRVIMSAGANTSGYFVVMIAVRMPNP